MQSPVFDSSGRFCLYQSMSSLKYGISPVFLPVSTSTASAWAVEMRERDFICRGK